MFNLRRYIVDKEYKTIKKSTDLYQTKDREILNRDLNQLHNIIRPLKIDDVKFIMTFLKHIKDMMFFSNDY